MKYHLITLAVAIASSAMLPHYASAQETTKPSTYQVELWKKFTNLPEKERIEFTTGLTKAQNLFTQKRIFDTLEKTHQLNKIFPDHPAVTQITGACYVETRDFPKAKEIFSKLLALEPKSPSILFNLAEIEFVSKNWANSDKQFSSILQLLDDSNKELTRLCEFKILLSKIQLGQIKEATAIKDKYDRWDDSPFYYYSRAALLHHEGKSKEASKLIRECAAIWNDPAALASWADTVKEYSLVPSIY